MTECHYCLETYTEEEALELCCNHKFHKKCILKWIESCDSFASCPICRKESISELEDHIFINKDIFESNKKNQINKNKELQELKQISENLQTETLTLEDTIHKLEEDCLYYKKTIIKLGHELNTLDYTLLEQKRHEINAQKEILKLKEENRQLKLIVENEIKKRKNIKSIKDIDDKWYNLINRILYSVENMKRPKL
tara:strand:+ start:171 stop:758 length:588 start_codon:yes stop_codon:yes gene_type:complete